MRIMTIPNASKNWTVFLLASLASLSILSLRLSGSSDRIWLSCEFAIVWFVAFFVRWVSSHQSKTNRNAWVAFDPGDYCHPFTMAFQYRSSPIVRN